MSLRSRIKWPSTAGLLRLVGIGLLVILLARLDLGKVRDVIRSADPVLLILVIVGIFPMLAIKTLRWQGMLRVQSIRLAIWPALLAYFGSSFIGLLTPGRLGEFIKAAHVSRDCGVSLAQAFSSVLADRLFDLYALMLVGCVGLLSLAVELNAVILVAGLALILTLPVFFYLNNATFTWFQRMGLKFGAPGRRLFSPDSLLVEVRTGLRQLVTMSGLTAAVALTVLAYSVYFGQCYLLARALGLSTGFFTVVAAVSLGGLVTLVPISISGVGTREAVITAYLASAGVQKEAALSFSLMFFAIFYIVAGLFCAVGWWIKPVPLNPVKRKEPETS